MQNKAVTQVLTLTNISGWTKRELTDLATASVAEIADNGDDVLSLLALSAKLEHFAKEVKDAAKERGITDLSKYGREGVAKQGVKLAIKEVGVRYDYSADPIWQLRDEAVKSATASRKEWETLLSAVPVGGMVVADPDTGSEYHAHRPARTASESITATIL